MSRTGLLWLVLALLVADVVVNVLQLRWAARRANPVPTPGRRGWDEGPATTLRVGQVVRSFHLGPRPAWVTAVRPLAEGGVELDLAPGGIRRVDGATVVKRWQPPGSAGEGR